MPESNYDALDCEERKKAAEYIPGYDWIPGRFGPPPGIAKNRKDEFDRMSDKEYLYAFLKLNQEEKESLMVSEAERRRTFVAHWPIESIVRANDCAKEGFYYTGVADRVQCAFCGGIIRNWDRGDVPKFQHKNFFNYCKIVQNKPCQNIPIGDCELPKVLQTHQLSSSTTGNKPTTLGDLNINTTRAKDPALSVFAKRRETYKRYHDSNPIDADRLCDAGFLYEGIGDKVKCFWCDGALEMWSKGDDPWVEHAKWYPGCTYVQQTKGLEFIKKARSQMSRDSIETAETLLYNKGDVDFLKDESPIAEEPVVIEELQGYMYLSDLGYNGEDIRLAYQANGDVEFEDPPVLVGIVQDLQEGDNSSLEDYKKEMQRKSVEQKPEGTPVENSTTQPGRRVNIPELITNPNEPTDQECRDLIDAMRCKKCRKNMSGAVVLPCGCFCLCQDCSKGKLPPKCLACGNVARGACRTFLS